MTEHKEFINSKEWVDDCLQFWGQVLTGRFAHFCPDWDGLPIDESCLEFGYCHCYPGNEAAQAAKNDRADEAYMVSWTEWMDEDTDMIPAWRDTEESNDD